MRSIWTGALSFGLVNIPVRVYSATTGSEGRINLDMLHKKDHSPIRYARICESDGQEVPWEDVVKGYEYSKGHYVVVTNEDFAKASPEKTKTIDILSFANADEIDSMYFDTPYYLEPDKGGAKPYALLREALRRTKKVGIARFVFRNREHIGAVKIRGDAIVLNQLRYKADVKEARGLELPEKSAMKDREIDMAVQLIEQLAEKFNPAEYKDTYTDELMKLIERKAHGRAAPARKSAAKRTTEAPDLMRALKASLSKRKAHRPTPKRKKAA